MKRMLCILLGLVLVLSAVSGCKPVEMADGGVDELRDYLSGNGSYEFMLTEDIEIDISEIAISDDRTIHLAEGVTLTITGEAVLGNGKLTIRSENPDGKKPIVDLSGLMLPDIEPQECTLIEIRCDVEFIPPAAQERLVVDTSNSEWTAIKMVVPIHEPESTPAEDPVAATAEELLEIADDPDVNFVTLTDDVSIDLSGVDLSHKLLIDCSGFTLTLSGTVTMDGGVLEIEDKSEDHGTVVDLSGLTVLCSEEALQHEGDIVFFRMGSNQIVGKPTVGEGMTFEIPDSGESASVKVLEIITPEQHEDKLEEEMTAYLNGNTAAFPGGVGISAEFLEDGVLEVHLDNPTISEVIGIMMDGGTKLILTGSVTFNGGNYGFELEDNKDTEAIVDITGLEIHGTAALGDTRSPDIFMARENVKIVFDETNPHIEVVVNDRFWLRYVQ